MLWRRSLCIIKDTDIILAFYERLVVRLIEYQWPRGRRSQPQRGQQQQRESMLVHGQEEQQRRLHTTTNQGQGICISYQNTTSRVCDLGQDRSKEGEW